ncbi:DUF2283 domain-containing protein [Candidatus Daviesbacteria bacterium]|nr:DUF2283 domain-containing protein [Candidatus Daviesbacteria bacterium]
MKAKYDKEADLLSLRISSTPYKYARQTGDIIVHYSEKKEPVLIEIVNATRFLKDTTKMLPKRIKEEISAAAASPSVAHRIR